MMGILIQVICDACRDTMKLDGSNEQGSTFTCPKCMATVIVRLKENVAYMPVPRCETCSEWRKHELEDIGTCALAANPPERHYPRALGDLETRADFGCVDWKAKS